MSLVWVPGRPDVSTAMVLVCDDVHRARDGVGTSRGRIHGYSLFHDPRTTQGVLDLSVDRRKDSPYRSRKKGVSDRGDE